MVDYGNTKITQLYNCTLIMTSVQVTGPLTATNALHVYLHVCVLCMHGYVFLLFLCFQYTSNSPKEQLLQKVLQPECKYVFVCVVCCIIQCMYFLSFLSVFNFSILLFQYFNNRKHYWAVAVSYTHLTLPTSSTV